MTSFVTESFASADRREHWGLRYTAHMVENYYRAPLWGLTVRCHGYTISHKSDEGQYTSL